MLNGNLLGSFFIMLLALIIVLLLAYVSLKMGNKYISKLNNGRNINIIERIPISNKSSLAIVKIGDDYLLVGISENGINLIKELKYEDIKQPNYEMNELKFNNEIITSLTSKIKDKWKK